MRRSSLQNLSAGIDIISVGTDHEFVENFSKCNDSCASCCRTAMQTRCGNTIDCRDTHLDRSIVQAIRLPPGASESCTFIAEHMERHRFYSKRPAVLRWRNLRQSNCLPAEDFFCFPAGCRPPGFRADCCQRTIADDCDIGTCRNHQGLVDAVWACRHVASPLVGCGLVDCRLNNVS